MDRLQDSAVIAAAAGKPHMVQLQQHQRIREAIITAKHGQRPPRLE